eukprot:1486173-Rhodomonas_salina.3
MAVVVSATQGRHGIHHLGPNQPHHLERVVWKIHRGMLSAARDGHEALRIFIIAIKLGPGPLTMKDSFVCLPGLDAKKELAGIDFAAVAAEAKKKEDAAQDDHGVPFGTIRAPCRLLVLVASTLGLVTVRALLNVTGAAAATSRCFRSNCDKPFTREQVIFKLPAAGTIQLRVFPTGREPEPVRFAVVAGQPCGKMVVALCGCPGSSKQDFLRRLKVTVPGPATLTRTSLQVASDVPRQPEGPSSSECCSTTVPCNSNDRDDSDTALALTE